MNRHKKIMTFEESDAKSQSQYTGNKCTDRGWEGLLGQVNKVNFITNRETE